MYCFLWFRNLPLIPQVGSYSALAGAANCTICPNSTTTQDTGAIFSEECLFVGLFVGIGEAKLVLLNAGSSVIILPFLSFRVFYLLSCYFSVLISDVISPPPYLGAHTACTGPLAVTAAKTAQLRVSVCSPPWCQAVLRYAANLIGLPVVTKGLTNYGYLLKLYLEILGILTQIHDNVHLVRHQKQ